ncbi:MAG: hypothetical protein PUP92_23680 [Rhizonema sp. PD38]|nr:hypothetical protein [Rhizonema sp. PD38]
MIKDEKSKGAILAHLGKLLPPIVCQQRTTKINRKAMETKAISGAKRHEEAKLEAMLLEVLSAGEPIEMTPEYWLAKRQKLQSRLRER